MKLPKTLDNIFKGAILGGALLLSPVQKVDADPFPYLALQNNWILGYGSSFANISNVPEYMRTVPIHPQDGSGNTIIPNDTIDFTPVFGTDLRIGGGFRDKYSAVPYDFNFGFKVGANILGLGGHEYNYTNAPGTEERGYGAALTQYKMELIDVTAGFFAKVELFDKLFVEYDIEFPFFQGILLQNGWDRYDKFQGHKDYYSNVWTLNHVIKVGLEFLAPSEDNVKRKFGIVAGTKIPQNVFTSASNEFGMTFSPSFFGGIQYTQGLEYNY